MIDPNKVIMKSKIMKQKSVRRDLPSLIHRAVEYAEGTHTRGTAKV